MKGIVGFVKREFFDILPVFLYFLFSTSLLFFTNGITLEHHNIHSPYFVRALIDSFIFTKAILIIDKCEFVNICKNKPLIYSTLWFTLIYLIFAFILEYVEQILIFMFKHKNFIEANMNLWNSMIWIRFWMTLLWGTILLFIYSSARSIICYLGIKKFRHIFFG